jgi:hypothetical protein
MLNFTAYNNSMCKQGFRRSSPYANAGDISADTAPSVTGKNVPSSPSLVTLMEPLSSSETSVLTRATRRNIPEGAILHSHRRENLKSYMITICEESDRWPQPTEKDGHRQTQTDTGYGPGGLALRQLDTFGAQPDEPWVPAATPVP